MSFKFSKFVMALVATIIAGLCLVAVLRAFGFHPFKRNSSGEPAVLLKEANDALIAVKERQPGERRPASYDAVLAPIDKLLVITKKTLEEGYADPEKTYAQVRSLANPIIDVADRANRQARSETAFLSKDYRFHNQKAEACQYLANALWQAMQTRKTPSASEFLSSNAPKYRAEDLNELRRILDTGIDADLENRELWYIRGVLNRAEGLLAPAVKDLERALEIDNQYAPAWNTLGLVRISLREFDKAEEALERARALTLAKAEEMGQQPGAEYIAALYNLATFHEGLASYYNRENLVNSSRESQRLTSKHADAARHYFQEFLKLEPQDSADYRTAQAKMQNLPR